MPTAAIVIDDWKFPTFKKHLTEAGYEFEKLTGFVPDTLHLQVDTDDLPALEKVVNAARQECAKARAH